MFGFPIKTKMLKICLVLQAFVLFRSFSRLNHRIRGSFMASLNVHFSLINESPRQLHCNPGGAPLPCSRGSLCKFHWDSSGHVPLGLDSHNNHPVLLRLFVKNESSDQGELHGIIVSSLQPHHQRIIKTATWRSMGSLTTSLQDKFMKSYWGFSGRVLPWLGKPL